MAPSLAPALLAPLLLAVALAGCSGAEGGGDAEAGAGEGAGALDPGASLPGVGKPAWAVGDAWTYDVGGEATTYVVTSETATDWIVETDSAERAFADARDDISRLGPQRKSDLAGSQGQDRVEFFRWPLEPGKSWATRWDGQDVTVRVLGATAESVQLEAVGAGGARVYLYSYDPAAGWFGELRRFDPDGTEAITLRLTGAVHGWSGTVVRWRLDEVVADSGSDGATASGPFDVPAGTTDLWADYHFTCTGAGGYLVAVQPANPGLAAQQGAVHDGPCAQVDWSDPLVDAPSPGAWAFAVDAGGQTVDYDYTILLRTREDVKFPA